VLRWHWRFAGGGGAEGARVQHRFARTRRTASVTAFDASGAQASARVGCPRAHARRVRRPPHPGARFTG
jgi:hypothetical protein